MMKGINKTVKDWLAKSLSLLKVLSTNIDDFVKQNNNLKMI